MRNFILFLLFITSFSLHGVYEDNKALKRTPSHFNLSQILNSSLPSEKHEIKAPLTKKTHEDNKDRTSIKIFFNKK